MAIPRLSGDTLTIPLAVGEQLYVVGANGTGKSALFHWWAAMDSSLIRRIAAHRQTWLSSGNLEFTARRRTEFEQNSRHWDIQANSRWMERSHEQRQSAVLFDLVARDDTRYRIIGQHICGNSLNQATLADSLKDRIKPLAEWLDTIGGRHDA